MLGVGGGEQLLLHQPEGAVHRTQLALADDHLALRSEGLFVQLQVEQAVGFQLKPQLQVLGGQIFEVGSMVPGGEGVDFAAFGLEDAGELLRPQGLGAPEHQVLEKVGNAGDPGRLVAGAHLVVNLQGDDGQTVIRQHQDR